jgi:hypothetical protein
MEKIQLIHTSYSNKVVTLDFYVTWIVNLRIYFSHPCTTVKPRGNVLAPPPRSKVGSQHLEIQRVTSPERGRTKIFSRNTFQKHWTDHISFPWLLKTEISWKLKITSQKRRWHRRYLLVILPSPPFQHSLYKKISKEKKSSHPTVESPDSIVRTSLFENF